MNRSRLHYFLGLLAAMVFAPSVATTIAAEKAPVAPPEPSDGPQAFAALRQLLTAYEEAQLSRAEALVEPQMIGYSAITDALRETGLTQKHLRITLTDSRTVVSGDIVIIRTRWEKRFLSLPALMPQRRSGSATFVMHREAGTWRLSAWGGDNLFAAN